MNINEKKEEIKSLINNLYFLSESDYPWEITSHAPDKHVLSELEEDIDLFFNNLSHPTNMVDDFMRTQAEKYDLLFQFLRANFSEINIVKQGRIKRPIVIELKDDNNQPLYLTSVSIES